MAINGIEMVTDRTLSDVEIAKSLIRRGFQNLTNSEKEAFLLGLKGAYNYTDVNRVEGVIECLSTRLYNVPSEIKNYANSLQVAWDKLFSVEYDKTKYLEVIVKKDWKIQDAFSESDRQRYMSNIFLVVSALLNTDDLPKTLKALTHLGANKIEKSLEDVDISLKKLQKDKETLIFNTSKSWLYSGEIYGGEI